MSFSFLVTGSAGEGMAANAEEEQEAVRAVVLALLEALKAHHLQGRTSQYVPVHWMPQVTDTYSLL